jgi:hypothetical protein
MFCRCQEGITSSLTCSSRIDCAVPDCGAIDGYAAGNMQVRRHRTWTTTSTQLGPMKVCMRSSLLFYSRLIQAWILVPESCTYFSDSVIVNVTHNSVRLQPVCSSIHRNAAANIAGYMAAWSLRPGHFELDGVIDYAAQWGRTDARQRFRSVLHAC